MKQHSFLSHTPEDMRRLSNLAHMIEGALIAIVGLLALLGNTGTLRWASTVWPLLILIAGIVLLFLLYPLHPMSEWGLIWGAMHSTARLKQLPRLCCNTAFWVLRSSLLDC